MNFPIRLAKWCIRVLLLPFGILWPKLLAQDAADLVEMDRRWHRRRMDYRRLGTGRRKADRR